MALNHFRSGHFKAKHFKTFGGLIAVIIEAVQKLPYWVNLARGRGKTVNTGGRLYYKSK